MTFGRQKLQFSKQVVLFLQVDVVYAKEEEPVNYISLYGRLVGMSWVQPCQPKFLWVGKKDEERLDYKSVLNCS